MLYVYTAITGEFRRKNQLRPAIMKPDPKGRKVRFVCFSGGDIKVVDPWSLRAPIWRHDSDPRRTARWHKLNPERCLPDAEYTLWIDGNQQLTCNPWLLVDRYLKQHDIATYRHPQRDCIYAEGEMCIRIDKDDPDVIRRHMSRYRKENYPEHNGLIESTVVLRRHTPAVKEFDNMWWRELAAGSRRDQLSANYCFHSLGMSYAVMAGSRDKPVYFRYFPHR